MSHDFKPFDRSLEDLRDATGAANVTIRDVVKRYVTMMECLTSAFTLYYSNLPSSEQAEMKEAYDKLADAVATFADESEDNVHPFKPGA